MEKFTFTIVCSFLLFKIRVGTLLKLSTLSENVPAPSKCLVIKLENLQEKKIAKCL